MNILLIQPKMNKRPMDTDLKTRMSPSLALLTLKALIPKVHNVRIINKNIERFSVSKTRFDGRPADLAAITVTVDVLPRAAQLSEKLKKQGIPVVAGGIHVTACPQECQPHFDAVCVGMAEGIWEAILRDAENGRMVGLYENPGGLRGGDVCTPDYGYVRQDGRYLYSNVVSTSRGCPHRCDFCYNSCADATPYMNRPIEDVLADIRQLGTRHVMFIDDNFIGNPAWTEAFLHRIDGMGLTWHAAVTPHIHKHPGLLDLMAKTGCQSLFIGFESVNPQSLSGVHKSNRGEAYDALVEAIHSRGIMVNASMVFGLDGDGPDVFDATLAWLTKNKVETLTAHIMTPYPGTELHRRLKAQGRITDNDLSHYNTSRVVFSPQGMNEDTLYKGYLNVYKRFYSLKSIIKRYPRQKAQRRAYLLFNLFYRKYGALTSAVSRLVPMGVLGRLAARLAYSAGPKAHREEIPGKCVDADSRQSALHTTAKTG